MSRRNPFKTARGIVMEQFGTPSKCMTVSRILRKDGRKAYVARKRPLFRKKNVDARLDWANYHKCTFPDEDLSWK